MVGGDKKLDYGKLRKLLKCKKVGLAQRSEVKEITGFNVGESMSTILYFRENT